MSKDTLLLNANAMPISWLPLSVISWQSAIRLLCLDVVDVLHKYPDWQVHSPSTVMDVPTVVILRKQVVGFRDWIAREDAPQAHLVFLRDMFRCQYCLKQFPRRQLTLDHVIPRRFGGQTHWRNLTTSCSPCNAQRGSNMAIRPATAPYRPTVQQLVRNMRLFPISVPDPVWNFYLKWDEGRIRVAKHHDIFEDVIIA